MVILDSAKDESMSPKLEKPPRNYVVVKDPQNGKTLTLTVYGTTKEELFDRIKSFLAGEQKTPNRRAS